MTFEQIFFRFCKENDMYGKFIKAVQKRVDWEFKHGLISQPSVQRKILQSIEFYGIRDFIPNTVGCDTVYYQYPYFKNFIRKWRYFVDNNLKLDEESIKNGDNVKAINYWTQEEENFDDIKIRKNGYFISHNYRQGLLNCITEINGEQKKVNWYYKRKGKIWR